MLTLQTVVMIAASVAGETVLIDFTADWCGPCRQMAPAVERLTQMGYPVRKVNIDQEPALAQQFQVRNIPCFVLVVDGREVDRQTGGGSFEQLQQMLAKHHVAPGSGVNQARGQSPDHGGPRTYAEPASARTPQRQPVSSDAQLHERLMAASVRLRIEDPRGHSYGSGTIIDARSDDVLILTCGHIFRDSGGEGRVTVDLFGDDAPQGVPGRVLCFDLKSDVGLVSFRPGCAVASAEVASAGFQVRRGSPVVNIGCNNGKEPTLRSSHVTSLDKFLGPPNLQVAGQPVQGRSGGGLFTADGRVIGVCNAADPADNEGLYAALPSIWSQLERIGWKGNSATADSDLVRRRRDTPPSQRTKQSEPEPLPTNTSAAPLMASAGPSGASAEPSMPATFSESENAALAEIQQRSQGAEVICIVRSLGDPKAKSEVIVLDKVSAEFLARLAAERSSQDARHLTSLAVGNQPAGAKAAAAAQVNSAAVARNDSSNVRPCPVNPGLITPASSKRAGDWRPQWLKPR